MASMTCAVATVPAGELECEYLRMIPARKTMPEPILGCEESDFSTKSLTDSSNMMSDESETDTAATECEVRFFDLSHAVSEFIGFRIAAWPVR